MRSGEQLPFISLESIRSALDAMLYVSTAPSFNPLEHLLLVDEFVSNPDVPASSHRRQFALNHILVSAIQDRYCHLRATFALGRPAQEYSPETALTEIATDAQCGGAELIGWGLLYYRYACTDTGLSNDIIAQFVHVDARTLRRYQQHALVKLTEYVVYAEWAARTRHRQRRLISELPSSVANHLIGRAGLIQQAHSVFGKSAPHHFQITGPAGIGKSAFAQEILRQQIETDQLDHVVWVQQPSTSAFARRYVIERLLSEKSNIDLREFLLMYRVGVVFDDADILGDEITELELLLDDLAVATVFLVSRTFFPLRNTIVHIPLGGLGESETLSLACALADPLSSAERDWDRTLHKTTGGNPLAVKLIVQSSMNALLPDEVYTRAYRQLSETQQRLWFMFMLFPPEPVEISRLRALWPSWVNEDDVHCLLDRQLIELSHDVQLTFRLAASAREYMRRLIACLPQSREFVSQLIDRVGVAHPSDALRVVENILLDGGLDTSTLIHRTQWMQTLCHEGIKHSHYATWASILEKYIESATPENIGLVIAYGVCLRYLSQWKDAYASLQKAIVLAGTAGLFTMQAWAALELSVVLRYQGQYDRANTCLDRIEATALRYDDTILRDALRMEQAQIGIDTGNAGQALSFLSDVTSPSLRFMNLQCEAYLLLDEWERCLDLASRIVDATGRSTGFQARIHTVIGRCYERRSDLRTARKYFGAALTLLERVDDPFALARAQANLGALLARSGYDGEAQQLLERAQEIQLLLGDRFALAASQHNLRLLEIERVDFLP